MTFVLLYSYTILETSPKIYMLKLRSYRLSIIIWDMQLSQKNYTFFVLFFLQLGFDSVHFARIDYQDRQKRKLDKSLEVIWRGSRTFGSSSQVNFLPFCFKSLFLLLYFDIVLPQIFANAFPVHYSAPSGFSFDITDDDTSPIPVQVRIFSPEIQYIKS